MKVCVTDFIDVTHPHTHALITKIPKSLNHHSKHVLSVSNESSCAHLNLGRRAGHRAAIGLPPRGPSALSGWFGQRAPFINLSCLVRVAALCPEAELGQ